MSRAKRYKGVPIILSTTFYRQSVIGSADNELMGRDIGVRLRHARKTLRNMTQQELAKSSGVKQATISDLETGESKSPVGTNLVRLAQSLRVSADWLAHGKGDMERPDDPLPPAAVALARDWLKLSPESQATVANLVRTMVKTSAADTPAVSDAKVRGAYGTPGSKKKSRLP